MTTRHALTLGSTGMLSQAALGLEAEGYKVSYLSRSGQLPENSSGTSHSCDWESATSLTAAVREAVSANGMPELVLAWAHGVGPVMEIARNLSGLAHNIRLHHVLGSSVCDPSRKNALKRIKLGFSELPGIRWHAIRLGFVRTSSQSRWLTHEEISEGTAAAIRLKTPIYTVGQTAPWKYRPQSA